MNRSQAFERALEAARATALNHRHAFVGTEHLLAGLLDDPTGLAAGLIAKAGLDGAAVRTKVLRGLRKARPNQELTADSLTLSRLAQKAVDQAVARARSGAASEVTDRDLLASLLDAPKGRTAMALGAGSPAHEALRAALVTGPGSPTPSGPRKRARSKPPRPDPAQSGPDPAPPRPRRVVVPKLPKRRWSLLLLLFVPTSVGLAWAGAPATIVFVAACVAILPLAALMGDATEAIAHRTGPTVGGLLNATFGNAAELIIALAALRAGLIDLVKASITGSILGNLLLILGLAMVAAGTGKVTVKFSRTNAGMSAAMLLLAVIGLVFPALFHAAHGPPDAAAELYMSEAVSVILILTYGLSLLFSLKTHRALFGGGPHSGGGGGPAWSWRFAIGVLALATLGVVVESELLVQAIEGASHQFGLSEIFVGLVIVPLVGNAAEHASAVVVARKGKMDLALQIALGSSTQIALLVAPLLVLAGVGMGVGMNLVFPVFQVLALGVSTLAVAIITLDGETHWFEGVQLLAVYALLATAAYFI